VVQQFGLAVVMGAKNDFLTRLRRAEFEQDILATSLSLSPNK